MKNKTLVAVYGSLRKGMYNSELLATSKYLGKFDSKPVFSLYALGPFPGLKPKGKTSVVMEVYEVDAKTLKEVDRLESYNEKTPEDNTFYNRVSLNTPFGVAYTYLYIPHVLSAPLVEDGDWIDYYEQNIALKKLLKDAEIL